MTGYDADTFVSPTVQEALNGVLIVLPKHGALVLSTIGDGAGLVNHGTWVTKKGRQNQPPKIRVMTWDSSVAHSQYSRSKQMTSACREHSARDRATAHGGVRELEGVSPISMGIGDWSQR